MPITIDAQQWQLLTDAPPESEITTLIDALFDELTINTSTSAAVRRIDDARRADFNRKDPAEA